ncbi:benzoate-CoA ligase [Panacagrimonas perspica]|uniref:Benzoate-CoA ligase n=1 Tax=Panacagrimonas perspica TaxID=381431 RepID=A0A4R7P3K7_9GAMM|nr:benzoate-CoA ligase family protein [Panacagrimonas perspica]TDU28002.1 benzoate-CoA ligase [Panacagrimonas perspica]THD03426.1 4-hydroxybenzoate--CoA ligase [Panacagrimonas perspica]
MNHAVSIEPTPERLNFAQHLLDLNASRADKLAYIDDAGSLSYGQLAGAVRRFAGALESLGLRREDRVLLCAHDSTDWPVAFLGCLYAGVVPVAVNTLLGATDYAYMIEHARARAVIVSQALLATIESAVQQSSVKPESLIVSRADSATLPIGAKRFEDLLAAGMEMPVAATTGRDDIAFWLYSSGSTGRPKGTVHTHGNLFATAATYGANVLGLREDDVTFSAAKLFFAYGLGNALTFPLSVGATVILMAERPTPDAVFKRLVDGQPSVFFGVPTLYAGMLASAALPARETVRIRRCTSAGEALPKEIGEKFEAHFGAPILDGIGSTEMLHIFLSNRADELRYGTSGKPVPGYELQLLDDSGAPVGADEVGDLYVKGDSSALMYWGNREKSRATFLGGWTKTGDKYVRDAQGWYTYAGRSDDMLKVSGQYVSPFEVECCLMQHEFVLEAALIGITDGDGLTKSKAFVVLRQGVEASDALAVEIKRFVKERLAPHKYPRRIDFIFELPKTPTGKIQRFKLRDLEMAALKPATP